MPKERTYYATPGITFDVFFSSLLDDFCKGKALGNESFTFEEVYEDIKELFPEMTDSEYVRLNEKVKIKVDLFVEKGYLDLDSNGKYSNYHHERWP